MRASVLILTLAACGSTVSGRVAGEPVSGTRTAAYDEIDVNLGPFGDYKAIALFITDVGDACEVFDAFYGNLEPDCAERCEDWGRIADEDLGAQDYWSLTLTLAADPDRVEGTYAWQDGLGEDTFDGNLTRWDVGALYDTATCEAACQGGGDVLGTRDVAVTGGSLEVTAYTEGERLEGTFDATLGGDTLDGRFRADRCDRISAWIGLGE